MSNSEQRRLVILGSILGLLVAVFAAKVFLVSDSNSSAGGTKPTVTNLLAPSKQSTRKLAAVKSVAKTVKKVATATTTPATAPPATFQVYATKNPFEPVIQIDTGGGTTPTTGGSGGTTPTTSGGGSTPTTTPSNAPPPGQTVTLLDVSRDSHGNPQARVQVGSTVYTVGEGATFANGQYRVVTLDAPCGQFLFGDSPFRLCEGEQTIK